MLEIYRKLWSLLDGNERRKAIFLLVLMMLMGFFEVIGVASIMPFISVVSNPDIVHSNKYINYAYKSLDFVDTDSFLLFLGSAVFLLILLGLSIKALTFWSIARFVHMRNYTLSIRLLTNYLLRPYTWYLNNHTADLGKTVLSEVQEVVAQTMLPSLQLISSLIVAIPIIILIILVKPVVALSALAILGSAYGLIYYSLRRYLARMGIERVQANQQRYRTAQEALTGIKEVKLYGLELKSVEDFSKPAKKFANTLANNQIIGQLPRFMLEAIAFGGILLIILYHILQSGGDANSIIPLVSLYAFSGYRMMPALQQIYQAISKIRFGKYALENMFVDLETKVSEYANNRKSLNPMHVRECILLENISYTYPGADVESFSEFTLEIPANSTVAIIGSTGAGKTTAIDIILGLIRPQSGALKIDGQEIKDNMIPQWQRTVGYVPQSIFLLDDSIEKNIAFGVPESEIDIEAVVRAAKIAEIDDFIRQELKHGYKTTVGERGIRISGGQRQRIGIARALYHNPDVLILDEATSALDNLTERAVMEAVHNLSHKKTIIMIAHRMSTVKDCDNLYLLDRGKLVAQGTYAELLANNKQFQAIVNR